MKLSQKVRAASSSCLVLKLTALSLQLMRGGKMNDYSEFEEEEEVDLQNLIGSKPAFAAAARHTKTSPGKAPTKDADEEDEFDADF